MWNPDLASDRTGSQSSDTVSDRHRTRGVGEALLLQWKLAVYIFCALVFVLVGTLGRPISHLIYTRVVASLVVVEDAVRRRRRVCVIQGASARESRGGGNDRYEHEHGRCDVVPSFLARREKRRIAASACMMF